MPAIKPLPAYLRDIQEEVEGYAVNFGLNFFPILYEVLDYKTMNEVAAYGGFPVRYPSWRFGMDYEQARQELHRVGAVEDLRDGDQHQPGVRVLARRQLDDRPEDRDGARVRARRLLQEQLLLLEDQSQDDRRHGEPRVACAPSSMARWGQDVVEDFIDTCLSLENLIDPMSAYIVRTRPPKPVDEDEEEPTVGKLRSKGYMDSFINPPSYLEAQKKKKEEEAKKLRRKFPEQPQRDVMQFLIEHAQLDHWQRDVLEIVRDEAYYFAPQAMTKIMNEGWATYWHSKILTEKALTAAEVIDYADACSGVLATSPGRLNPYKLGVELYRNIEDRWNKGQYGKEWDECDSMEQKRNWDRRTGLGRQKIFEVRKLYNDITFLDEFFTLEFCIDQKFYTFGFQERSGNWEIMSREFKKVKDQLLKMLTNRGQPAIVVEDGNFENRSELLLRHVHEGTDLDGGQARDTLRNAAKVWTRPVSLLTKVEGKGKLLRCEDGNISERSAEYS